MRQENAFARKSASLLINSENVMDPKIVADAFKTFFLTVAENLHLHQGGEGMHTYS
jgi:hypothetical protein